MLVLVLVLGLLVVKKTSTKDDDAIKTRNFLIVLVVVVVLGLLAVKKTSTKDDDD